MNTAIINFKTDPQTKKQAQKVAKDLGLHLSAILNAYLKELTRTKEVNFSLNDDIPNEETIQAFREAEEEMRSPEYSTKAMTPEQALAYVVSIIREKSKAGS